MRESTENENPPQQEARSHKELFLDYLSCYTFYYQLALAVMSLLAIICFSATTFTGGLLSFCNFFVSIILISVIIDFILRSLNFHAHLPDFMRSSILLSGLYAVGTIVSVVCGILLMAKIGFISLVIGGICSIIERTLALAMQIYF
ncbi:hypothetical protein HZS_6459 [Henneguya salminicola]|nr:hypothetical protein HZS_6459 [Henneguya salminicola]